MKQAFCFGALLVTACGPAPAPPADTPERVTLEGTLAAAQDRPLPSPDTSAASWTVDETGQSIHFGDDDAPPLLTLDCQLEPGLPRMAVIRHASALPGQTALFPIYGNGMRTRLLADARLAEGEWRWEAVLPAGDPQLDVFAGPRDLVATLPGKGMLEIRGSRIPGEFVEWCRAGGRVVAAEALEAGEPSEKAGEETGEEEAPAR